MNATAHPAPLKYCRQPPRRMPALPPGLSPSRTRAILREGKKWVNGSTLGYYCYVAGDGSPAAWHGKATDVDVVETAFSEWADLGIGISFRRVQRPEEADMRIAFDAGDGSWSYVGRDALAFKQPGERTMNFGWPLTTRYGHDTALHEIGHALGLEHEHQNPFAGIVWNEAAVRKYFRGAPNHWSDADIEHNILEKIDEFSVKGTQWDPNSVMEYEFEAGLIDQPAAYRDGLTPAGGLSDADRAWIRESYPERAQEAPLLEIGLSRKLDLGAGETRTFRIAPAETRTYRIATFGTSDTVLVLFERTLAGNVKLAADDDSGEDRNASITAELAEGRQYEVGVRLFHADAPSQVSLMAW